MSLAKDISQHMADRNYQWAFKDEGKRVPTEKDVQEGLDRAKSFLENVGDEDHSFHWGRLIVSKEAGHYDVYVHFGEL